MLKSWKRIEFFRTVVAGLILKQAVPNVIISSRRLEEKERSVNTKPNKNRCKIQMCLFGIPKQYTGNYQEIQIL